MASPAGTRRALRFVALALVLTLVLGSVPAAEGARSVRKTCKSSSARAQAHKRAAKQRHARRRNKTRAHNTVKRRATKRRRAASCLLSPLRRASADTTAPTVPKNFAAAAHDGAVALSWSPSKDSRGVAGYHVYQLSGETWTVVATATSTSFTVAGLTNGVAYRHTVSAFDAAGNESKKAPELETTPVGPDTTSPPPATTTAPPPPAPGPVGATSVDCGFGSFDVGIWPAACWRPFGDSSPFNQPVPASPRLHSNSAAIVSRMLGMGPIPDLLVAPDTTSDWYHPVYYSRAGDPLYTVHCTRSWGTCEVEGMQVRIPAAARPAGGGDGHMAVIDQATGWEYDFWQVVDKPAAGGTITINWGGRTEIKGDGLGSDATAALFGLTAGIIRAPELAAGHIDHALFMLVGCTSHQYVYPAKGYAGNCSDQTNAPADGQYFWLDMTDAEIDALAVPGWKKTILRALAHYGAFVGDTGGNESFGFEFESGSTYTSFGFEDAMAVFARQQTQGVTASGGRYYFDLASGVDWKGRLRVLDPCVAQRTC